MSLTFKIITQVLNGEASLTSCSYLRYASSLRAVFGSSELPRHCSPRGLTTQDTAAWQMTTSNTN